MLDHNMRGPEISKEELDQVNGGTSSADVLGSSLMDNATKYKGTVVDKVPGDAQNYLD